MKIFPLFDRNEYRKVFDESEESSTQSSKSTSTQRSTTTTKKTTTSVTTTPKTTISTIPSSTTFSPSTTTKSRLKYQDEQKAAKNYFSNSFHHNNNNYNRNSNNKKNNNQINHQTTKSAFKFVNNFSTKSPYTVQKQSTTTTEAYSPHTRNPYYTPPSPSTTVKSTTVKTTKAPPKSTTTKSTTKGSFVFSKYTFAHAHSHFNKNTATKKPEISEIDNNFYENDQQSGTTTEKPSVKYNPVFDIYFRQIASRKSSTKNPFSSVWLIEWISSLWIPVIYFDVALIFFFIHIFFFHSNGNLKHFSF